MSQETYSDDLIASVLRDNTSIAMVGASANTSRPSYFAMKYLLGKGYRVVPVNVGLAGQQLLGQQVYASLADVPAPIGIVDIFRNSEAALEVTREALSHKDRLGVRVIWMQLGVRNEQATAEAEAAGLTVIVNRCPKIEYGRLSGEIGWAGVATGRLTSTRPKLSPKGVQSHLLSDKT